MKTIKLVIPDYDHDLTEKDFRVIFDELIKHTKLIKQFNNQDLHFDGLIVKKFKDNNRIFGWILDDAKERAENGQTIRTSPVKMELQLDHYSNVSIVKTLNSKYLVVG